MYEPATISGHFDGAHRSGVVRCRSAVVDQFWNNAVIRFTTDDLSLEANGKERLDPSERRDVCEFGNGCKWGTIASGRDLPKESCRIREPWKCSWS